MERITVTLAANAAYGDPLQVAVGSIAGSASRPVRFMILDGGLREKQRRQLLDIVARNGSCSHELRFVPVNEARFCNYRPLKGNAMAYVRFLLPDLLTEDWALYVDADVLWKRDVALLWDLRDDAVSLVATPDCAATARKEGAVPGEYFCSGILLLNLAFWRANGVKDRCLAWLDAHPDADFHDQSALNAVLKGTVRLVDKSWNRYVEEPGECHVLHYAGANPWQFGFRKNRLDRYKLMWFRELAKLKGTSLIGEIVRTKWAALRKRTGA